MKSIRELVGRSDLLINIEYEKDRSKALGLGSVLANLQGR
jgi:hypothetical protein